PVARSARWPLTWECVSFFFQAEDGIRDGHVTGVQTCALPISRLLEAAIAREIRPRRGHVGSSGDAQRRGVRKRPSEGRVTLRGRSEERRVGKECRSRRSTACQTKT